MHDVEPRLYTTVIRETIRHENDVINHRIMWLMIGQGLIANAYVGAGSRREEMVSVLAPVGILVTLSAFLILACLFVLLPHTLEFGTGMVMIVGTLQEAAILSGLCVLWVWAQAKREDRE